MTVEELVAKLSFKMGGQNEARKFVKQLDDVKKAAREAGKGLKLNFTGNTSGLKKIATDFDRLASSAKRARVEMERISRVRYPRGGFGGNFMPPGYHPGRRSGRGAGHGGAARGGGSFLPGAAGEFASGVGAGAFAARAGVVGAGALGAGLVTAGATKTAMDFQRAMIDVSKATDASPEERAGYEKSILDLSRATGKGKEELAGILAAAGFAGRPKGDLMRFTEYGGKAATAWGTSAEDAGQALAEIGNIFEAAQPRIEQIGDAIDKLADVSASNEPALLEYLRRTGASGKLSGISAENMLAIGAFQKERGIRTDTAATATEALLNMLRLGEEFSNNADDGLKMFGIKSEKLRKDFYKKPIETLIGFLDKVSKVTDPKKRDEALVKTFGKEYQDDIGKMLGGLPRLKELLAMSNNKGAIEGSVRNSFEKRLQEEVTKVDQATQSIKVLGNRLGDAVLKNFLGPLAEATNRAVDDLEGTPRKITDADKESAAKLARDYGIAPGKGDTADWNWWGAGSTANAPWITPPKRAPLMTMPTPSTSYSIDPGSLQSRFGTDWLSKGAQQTSGTVQNITNNDVGNDHRTQTANVTVNATGLEAVGAAVLANVKAGLSSLGASVAKTSSTPTTTMTAP
jgi:TP901 family phage tail tape measure protein